MGEFWMGVVSSVAASGLLVGFGWITSSNMRRRVRRALLQVTGAGVLETFKSQREAAPAVAAALAEARSVRVFAGRGNELTRDTFHSLWETGARKKSEVKVLLPDPDETGPGSWIDDHEQEAVKYDGGQAGGLIVHQIRVNVAYIENVAKNLDHVELALYDYPSIGRLVITEKVAFLTAYSDIRHGADSPCVMLSAGHPLYDFAARLFDKVWQTSRRP
ncbi:hypothetical protein AB0395_05045 [Streptosporangium sp. NPDC051023]|uniref:hypothetical protein n=1 Tax=Streptosporangium sp. NPDC051023 TaxID=3155410 RepID=UPI003450873D